jgi:flagellar biosynthesis protein FlhF
MSLPANAPGTCYKFVVDSAHEAASVIRDRLGENARVLSVRTIAPTGLRSLWGSPKIEVLATVSSVGADPGRSSADGRTEQARPVHLTSGDEASPVASAPTKLRMFSAPVARDLAALLRRSGFSDSILARLQNSSDWAALCAMPLHRALVETSRTLQRIASARKPVAPLTRAAFIGLAGSGRTTALCKWLASEVSRRARVGHVVAAEFDQPLSRGPLPIFCEALGVPLAHYPASTQPAAPGAFVYFDLPPLSLRDPRANEPLASFLDREEIAQRVLVLNAAYGPDALRAGYARGRELQATHVVFTHLDERVQWGGLWDLLLDGGLEPLFLTTGPSLTGECEEDVYDALARRTLPVALEDDRWSSPSPATTAAGLETDAHLDEEDAA